ncbi:MAG: heparinase II/III family protein [Armatimonadetes bacterium]|nr:heparinase II/III family protein [Armatimonadota bacterium]
MPRWTPDNPMRRPSDWESLEAALYGWTPAHPTILLTSARVLELRALSQNDPVLSSWIGHVRRMADEAFGQTPAAFAWITVYGPSTNNIEAARLALKRIQSCGLVWQLSGDVSYAARAREEAVALAQVPWGGDYDYLATAEATHALAIAYDWLYDCLTPGDRALILDSIRRAILNTNRLIDGGAWWLRKPFNANSVMTASAILGALAYADVDKDLAFETLRRALPALSLSIGSLGSDGGWMEGYTYWDYGTRYMAYGLSALETTLGGTFGLDASPGLQWAGDYKLIVGGPRFQAFNFADSITDASPAAQMLYFARKYNRPEWAACERKSVAARGPWPMHVVWYTSAGTDADIASRVPSKVFHAGGLAALRDSLTDGNAAAAALKAGENGNVHCMQELGNFLFEAMGVRWAIDFGYYDGGFRALTSSQNLLLFDGRQQAVNVRGSFVDFSDDVRCPYAVADLSSANPGIVSHWRRGVALPAGKWAMVQDEFVAAAGTPVQWKMHTFADVETFGSVARLTQNGKSVTMIVSDPPGAVIEVAKVGARATTPADANANEVQFRFVADGSLQTVRVLLLPEWPDQLPPMGWICLPLDQWSRLYR